MKTENKTVVVTGANGFVGVHTVKKLLEKGYKVKAVDVNTDKLSKFMNPDLTIHQIDVASQAMSNVMQQGDKVLHLAAIAKFEPARLNPQFTVKVNVEGTLNVVQACIEKNVDRLVFSSTGSVYSLNAHVPIREDASKQPQTVYGLTKKMAEDWITFFGNQLPYVILRYGYIYGNHKDWGAVGAFIKKLLANEQPVVYGGTQTNDFIYIKDVVDANLLALETEHTRQAYNIGTGRATSIRDVCDYCIEAMNSDLTTKIEAARTFDYSVFVYDITKARTLLGFNPKWNVLNGIKDMVEEKTIRI